MRVTRFQLNTPGVVAETLEGEATIVDLDNGTYYALNDSGSVIWDEVCRGRTREEVAASLAERYDVHAEEAEEAVGSLLDKLAEHRLIRERNGEPPQPGAADPPSMNGSARPSFIPPELSVYTDMQELLLLDPIHEVDESGWPNQQP